MTKNKRKKPWKLLFLPLLILMAVVFAGCTGSAEEKKTDTDNAAEEEEESATQKEIDEIMNEELTPLDEEELAMLEDFDEGETLKDDEMRPLSEEELEQEEVEVQEEEKAQEEEEALKEEELTPVTGEEDSATEENTEISSQIKEDGTYTEKTDVAVYIHTYGKLPSNYITEEEAKKLGWVSSRNNLDEVAPGKSIGGDIYANENKMLPEEDGRTYQQCDIDYEGGARGEKRLVFSNDGLIFYSEDHYETFEQLY